MRPALLVLLLCGPALPAADPEPKDPRAPKPREIAAAGLGLKGGPGGVDSPARVNTPAGLEKVGADEKAEARLKKEVDFSKEYLLVFAWSGSGGDRLVLK